MWTWNEFLIPLVMVNHTADVRLLTAGAAIVAVPVVIVYLFLCLMLPLPPLALLPKRSIWRLSRLSHQAPLAA